MLARIAAILFIFFLFYLSFHRTKTNQLKETALRHTVLAKQISHMYTQSKTSGTFSVTGQCVCVCVCMGMQLMQSH